MFKEGPDIDFASTTTKLRQKLLERDQPLAAGVEVTRCFLHTQSRTALYYVLNLVTLGSLSLLAKWFPLVGCYFRYWRSTFELCNVIFARSVQIGPNGTKYIIYKGAYVKSSFPIRQPFRQIVAEYGRGLTSEQADEAEQTFGRNNIDVPVKGNVVLLKPEVMSAWSSTSIILWVLDAYYVYSVAIFLMSAISATQTVITTRRSLEQLARLAHLDLRVTVKRDGVRQELDSGQIVPGDLVQIVPQMVVPCDLLALAGQASVLTSKPVIKSPIPAEEDTAFDPALHTSYTLFSGTKVLSVKAEDGMVRSFSLSQWALAFGTGFTTNKGTLIKALLYPKPTQFKFYSDSLKFIGVLFLIALAGVIWSFYHFITEGASVGDIFTRSMDVITIVVPPALPVAMAMGTGFAIRRLRRSQIFCISPIRVNVGGKVDLLCFDKTGTLTREGLDVYGAHEFTQHSDRLLEQPDGLSLPFRRLLAACHSLTRVEGTLIGDQLELEMFEWMDWTLEETAGGQWLHSPDDLLTVAIEKRFDFSADLKRMSTAVLSEGRAYGLVKGAPEVIRTLCEPDSLPTNFDEVLKRYTTNGFRVIGCASKDLGPLSKEECLGLKRKAVETGLHFHGFFLLQNQLKEQTLPTLQVLNRCGFKSVMITGDNVLTAVHVAQGCELMNPDLPTWILDVSVELMVTKLGESEPATSSFGELLDNPLDIELAVTGPALELLSKDPELLGQVAARAKVFARMAPEQKAQLVSLYQQLGWTDAMVGDGANDCAALKAADIGLSLSQEEASIAAPFTSTEMAISSVIDLLRECRCALATSIQIFKFMALYSIIQFTTVLLCYNAGTALGDWAFLWIDLFLIVPLFFLMARTPARKELSPDRPVTRLVSLPVLLSVITHSILVFIFQLMAWLLLWIRADYVSPYDLNPVVSGSGEWQIDYQTQDTTVLFTVGNFQYQWVVIAFSIGRPFRRNPLRNIALTITLALGVLANAYFLFLPGVPAPPNFNSTSHNSSSAESPNVSERIADVMEITWLPTSLRLELCVLLAVNLTVTWLFERFVVGWLLRKCRCV